MGAEWLDWVFAAGQGLFGASFFYFLYLVVRFSGIETIIRGRPEAGPEAAPGSALGSSVYSFSGE